MITMITIVWRLSSGNFSHISPLADQKCAICLNLRILSGDLSLANLTHSPSLLLMKFSLMKFHYDVLSEDDALMGNENRQMR